MAFAHDDSTWSAVLAVLGNVSDIIMLTFTSVTCGQGGSSRSQRFPSQNCLDGEHLQETSGNTKKVWRMNIFHVDVYFPQFWDSI